MISSLVERPWLAVLIEMVALLALEERTRPAGASRAGAERILTNFALYALGLALIGLAGALVPHWPDNGAAPLVPGFGLAEWADLPWAAVLAALILTDSLLAYGLHRASHRFDPLWRLHAVHHADRTLDVTTAIRHHPLEMLPSLAAQLAAAALCGATPTQTILVALGNSAWVFYTHAAIGADRPHFRWLGRVLVSPAFHRLHHSCDARQTDSNYGNTFAFWDWLLGTASDPVTERPGEIGLGPGRRGDEKLLAQLLAPFRRKIA